MANACVDCDLSPVADALSANGQIDAPAAMAAGSKCVFKGPQKEKCGRSRRIVNRSSPSAHVGIVTMLGPRVWLVLKPD